MKPFPVLNVIQVLRLSLLETKYPFSVIADCSPEYALVLLMLVLLDDRRSRCGCPNIRWAYCACTGQILNVATKIFFILEALLLQQIVVELPLCPAGVGSIAAIRWVATVWIGSLRRFSGGASRSRWLLLIITIGSPLSFAVLSLVLIHLR